eukprot:TRINITY_DN10108_c0_g1_i1.p1 TRINITY_DN10108_c0_g1~~TRINITY_DN10108_c0_g1_i1.p1  ORF type:complete len:574 (+),score=129.52 TRINITY_DN10108_c0_g1_i1:48-1769(+)
MTMKTSIYSKTIQFIKLIRPLTACEGSSRLIQPPQSTHARNIVPLQRRCFRTSIALEIDDKSDGNVDGPCGHGRINTELRQMLEFEEDEDDQEPSNLSNPEPKSYIYNPVLGKASHEVDQATKVLVLQPWFNDARLQACRPPDLQLQECCSLVESVDGLRVEHAEVLRLRSMREKSFFTKGKLQELHGLIQRYKNRGVQAVMINTTRITPRQQHALQTAWNLPVYDRFAIILAIFESRAVTKEARLQVELAKIDYAKSQLVVGERGGYDRQRGGLGALGGSGGETQLERDRRKLNKRQTKIKGMLEVAMRHRQRLRDANEANDMPVVAVVGYTNAGKTALVRALSEDDSLVPENKLFATLDTAVRAGKLPQGTQALFVDTVGFVSDLPTSLVAAFKSTLEDIRTADVLVHVTDASDPDRYDQHASVIEVLSQLDLPDKLLDSRLCVHNKIDLKDSARPDMLEVEVQGASHSKRRHAEALWRKHPALEISVTTGDNLDELRQRIEAAVLAAKGMVDVTLRVKHDRQDVLQFAYKHGTVTQHNVTPDGQYNELHVKLNNAMIGKLKALKEGRHRG